MTCSYPSIAGLLDEVDGLRGRYIVLPNVSQGHHTVLKAGGHRDFLRMPYVGGYLDRGQTIETLSHRNQRRLSGVDGTWSQRRIYPLPTSDSRESDYAALGVNETWIKLAEPTAEAIRQAFLGYPSRIAIEPVKTPSMSIVRAEIIGSRVLVDTTLEFSPEFTAVIGGRGTGKSSLLEYVAFALGRSCHDVDREHYTGAGRMRDLVKDTLVARQGRVSLEIRQDGASFSILREAGTAYQPQLRYPNGMVQAVTAKELRRLFPATVYGQGELAEVGRQTGERTHLADFLQLVAPDHKREDDRLAGEVGSAKTAVAMAIQAVVVTWRLQSQLRELQTKLDARRQRLEALQATLPTLGLEDQRLVDHFELAESFNNKRIRMSKQAEQVVKSLEDIRVGRLSYGQVEGELGDEASEVAERYGDLSATFERGLLALKADVGEKRAALVEAELAWDSKFDAVRKAQDGVLSKLDTHRTVTEQMAALREQLSSVTSKIGDIESQLGARGDAAEELRVAVDELRRLNGERNGRTEEWARELERLSGGKVKATVVVDGDVSEIQDAVDTIAAKTGSQEVTRIRELQTMLAEGEVADVLDRLRSDCLGLLHWRDLGGATGEERPACLDLMRVLGSTGGIRKNILERLDASRVGAIATAVAKPEIALSYRDGAHDIPFEKASEGQRAAALLFILLEQQGGPLIIDQPEGDLDNRVIAELTDKLHQAKRNRQLVFASHNANIVVNGSAELVGQLGLTAEGDRAVSCSGAIDKREVCDVITATMEGGEKAFRDRQDKYGY